MTPPNVLGSLSDMTDTVWMECCQTQGSRCGGRKRRMLREKRWMLREREASEASAAGEKGKRKLGSNKQPSCACSTRVGAASPAFPLLPLIDISHQWRLPLVLPLAIYGFALSAVKCVSPPVDSRSTLLSTHGILTSDDSVEIFIVLTTPPSTVRPVF